MVPGSCIYIYVHQSGWIVCCWDAFSINYLLAWCSLSSIQFIQVQYVLKQRTIYTHYMTIRYHISISIYLVINSKWPSPSRKNRTTAVVFQYHGTGTSCSSHMRTDWARDCLRQRRAATSHSTSTPIRKLATLVYGTTKDLIWCIYIYINYRYIVYIYINMFTCMFWRPGT